GAAFSRFNKQIEMRTLRALRATRLRTGLVVMRDRSLRTAGISFARRALWVAVRVTILAAMMVVGGFTYIAAMRTQVGNYDPHAFAVGLAGLIGAACGGLALLFARVRNLKIELRTAQQRAEELADRIWELKESEERAKSFLASQGDVIIRRDTDARITY